MRSAIAVDLGSSRTRVADATGRILVDEPTVAAVDARSGELLALGERALLMPTRAAGDVVLVRPVAHGQLQDLSLTDQVAESLLARVRGSSSRHPEVLCTAPGLASSVQRRAVERAFKRAGAAEVEFIQQALAGGIGLRLKIDEPVATMVVDVGGGTTDVAVMALGGVVTEASVPVGGGDIDAAVRELLCRSFDLVVSPEAAERAKIAIGSAWPEREAKIELVGRDVANGIERRVVLTSSEVAAAAADRLRTCVNAAVDCIVAAPPDLANDLLARGLHLVGSGGRLSGLARKLATAAGIPVHLAPNPGRAAVLGAARCLNELGGGVARATSPKASAYGPVEAIGDR